MDKLGDRPAYNFTHRQKKGIRGYEVSYHDKENVWGTVLGFVKTLKEGRELVKLHADKEFKMIKIEDTHLSADRFYMHEGTGSVAMGKEWFQDFLDMRDENQSFNDWEDEILIEVEFVNGGWREVE